VKPRNRPRRPRSDEEIEAIANRIVDLYNRRVRGDEPFYIRQTLARHLGVSARTIQTILKRGDIPSRQVGTARRIDPDDVARYLAARVARTAPPDDCRAPRTEVS
jgi:excisionase family DNA binding protein